MAAGEMSKFFGMPEMPQAAKIGQEKRSKCILALRLSKDVLRKQLIPHAFGIMLGLEYYGIFDEAEVKAFRANVPKHAGRPTLVDELLGLIEAKEANWWSPLITVLGHLKFNEAIETLTANLDSLTKRKPKPPRPPSVEYDFAD